jgi:hypothetical protein
MSPSTPHPAGRDRSLRALAAGLAILLAPLPFLGDLRRIGSGYLLLAVAATLLLYVGAWLLRRRGIEPSTRVIMTVALLLRLLMLPMLPSLSDDAYRYLWDGRLLLHGVSPYLHIPADSSLAPFHDGLFRLQGYPTTNTIYPPGAQLLFAGSMAFGEAVGGGWPVGYIVYKLFLIGVEMGALWLLLRTLGRLRLPLSGAILYAWHPLVVIELAGQGHTDAFWVLGLAIALHGYVMGTSGGGIGGVAFGGALRLYPFALIPLWWRFIGRRRMLIGLAASLPVLLLFVAMLDPRAIENYTTVLGRFTNYYEFNGGFYYAVKGILDHYHIKPSNVIAGAIGTGTQLALLLAVLLWPLRDRTARSLALRALLLTSATIVLGAKVHVWYFVAPLFLLPLVPGSALSRAWRWAALVAPFTYLIYAVDPPRERMEIVAIEWGGFLLLALFDLRRSRMGRGATVDPA